MTREKRIQREELLERLRKDACPTRLTTPIVAAMAQNTGEDYLRLIQRNITSKLRRTSGPMWAAQFEDDLKTYGLMEAIGFFHTYDPQPPDWLVDDSIRLYADMAKVFTSSNPSQSLDPKVRTFLRAARSRPHAVGFTHEPIAPKHDIADPKAPKKQQGYKRRLPLTELEEHFPFIRDSSTEPQSFEHELLDHIRSELMQYFPGFEQLYYAVAIYLREHSIDPFDSSGQWIIQQVCGDCEDELFGAFDTFAHCPSCGESFRPDISREAANKALVSGGNYCNDCDSQGRRRIQ